MEPGDVVDAKQLYLILFALKLAKQYVISGTGKDSTILALEEALELFKKKGQV